MIRFARKLTVYNIILGIFDDIKLSSVKKLPDLVYITSRCALSPTGLLVLQSLTLLLSV